MTSPNWQTIRHHSGDIFRLAVPTIASRAGFMIMMIVDTVMVGHYSASELAYQSIGLAPMMFIMVASFGLLTGTMVVTAYNRGAKLHHECGPVWWRSIYYAIILGLIGLSLSLFGEEFLALTGQSNELVKGGGSIIRILGFGVPPMFIYVASAFFLEGLKRPLFAMYMMVAGNIVNAGLNWVLIFGHFGMPEMGAEGSAWATVGVRTFLATCIIIYVWNLPDRLELGIPNRPKFLFNSGWQAWRQQRKIGYGAGVSNGLESAAFSSMSLMAGVLGVLSLASYSIAFNMLALVYMIALGFGSATAVCVGNAHGRKDFRDMAYAGWIGLGLTMLTMAVFGMGLQIFNAQIAAGFTGDAELAKLAAPLIAFIAIVAVADGGQSIMAHALRGRGETWSPAAMHVVSYLFIMIPLAWYLAHSINRGARGLFESILIASLVSLTLLSFQFWCLSRRDQQRAL